MKAEVEKFSEYVNSILEPHLSKEQNISDFNDIVENMTISADNAGLRFETIGKELNNINKYASYLIDNYEGAKTDLETKLKSVAENIINEYLYR